MYIKGKDLISLARDLVLDYLTVPDGQEVKLSKEHFYLLIISKFVLTKERLVKKDSVNEVKVVNGEEQRIETRLFFDLDENKNQYYLIKFFIDKLGININEVTIPNSRELCITPEEYIDKHPFENCKEYVYIYHLIRNQLAHGKYSLDTNTGKIYLSEMNYTVPIELLDAVSIIRTGKEIPQYNKNEITYSYIDYDKVGYYYNSYSLKKDAYDKIYYKLKFPEIFYKKVYYKPNKSNKEFEYYYPLEKEYERINDDIIYNSLNLKEKEYYMKPEKVNIIFPDDTKSFINIGETYNLNDGIEVRKDSHKEPDDIIDVYYIDELERIKKALKKIRSSRKVRKLNNDYYDRLHLLDELIKKADSYKREERANVLIDIDNLYTELIDLLDLADIDFDSDYLISLYNYMQILSEYYDGTTQDYRFLKVSRVLTEASPFNKIDSKSIYEDRNNKIRGRCESIINTIKTKDIDKNKKELINILNNVGSIINTMLEHLMFRNADFVRAVRNSVQHGNFGVDSVIDDDVNLELFDQKEHSKSDKEFSIIAPSKDIFLMFNEIESDEKVREGNYSIGDLLNEVKLLLDEQKYIDFHEIILKILNEVYSDKKDVFNTNIMLVLEDMEKLEEKLKSAVKE